MMAFGATGLYHFFTKRMLPQPQNELDATGHESLYRRAKRIAGIRPLQAHGEAPDDAFAALKSVVEVSAVFVALAFVTGWSYMASYYTQFGLNPFELDFSGIDCRF